MLPSVFSSWPFEPWLLVALGLTGTVYLRGWRDLHRRDQRRWPASRPVAFCGGLVAIYLALGSPIEPMSSLLLQVHMLQHMLLMMVAPPLIWLGSPKTPLLKGLPHGFRMNVAVPLLQVPAVRNCWSWLTQPVVALLQLTIVNWAWHSPPAYELALRSPEWHYVQHMCFFVSGLVFWRAIVGPSKIRRRSPWLLVACLFAADVQNTALAAMLTFSHRVLYPLYSEVPRLGGLSVLDDQAAAGALMWLIGSLAFLPPLVWIGVRALYGTDERSRLVPAAVNGGSPSALIGDRFPTTDLQPEPTRRLRQPQMSLPILQSPSIAGRHQRNGGSDLLQWPVVGRFLKWRHARLALQLPMLLLAGVMIVDGLRGPQIGAMNLAGVLPWIHWRGLLILTLLVAGNFFCTACPFVLPRALARRWLPAGHSWPRWLRSKWLAVSLLVVFLWAYEALGIWDSPWWTAWLAIAYFVAAFTIDGVFKGAAFCKYVCPIGQFNFVQSLCSPLEVRAVNLDVCSNCKAKDCIRGNQATPGCEMRLFLPRKVGNMDCTFCLDCIHACPHENVGIIARRPGGEIDRDAPRSGVGWLSKRIDLAALAIVLVFGAFANAAGMVAPVAAFLERCSASLGQQSSLPVISAFYFAALLVLPALTVGLAASMSRHWGRLRERWLNVAARFAFCLVPLGFGMWLAHYSYHLVTSYDTIVPVALRAASDSGMTWLARPEWIDVCCRPAGDAPLRLEIVFLDIGLLLSLFAAYRVAVTQAESRRLVFRAFVPWALLALALFAIGVWIIFQPMQMRGTLS
jgi:cytochrome c oxidase assembly factor CtaG/polyferredoxin